jgi:anti-sigma B factor antagonist
MTQLRITTERRDGTTRVSLAGELDIASTEGLDQELETLENDASVIVLDLREVEFIDSTGVRTLIAADERARSNGRRLVIVRGSNAVDRLLSVTQLDRRLEIVDDPDSV